MERRLAQKTVASTETKLKCSHDCDVTKCLVCTALIPSSFWERLNWKRFPPEENTIHVTSLSSCLTKAYFDANSCPEETVESAWAKLRGTLLHYAGRSLGWNELKAKLTFQLDGTTITIVGHLDAYDPESGTIFDLKTTRFVEWQATKGFIPRLSHIEQIQCYYTLLDSYGIPVNRLVLLYVDDKSIVPKEVPLVNRREWMISRATILHQALAKSELPTPEPGDTCKYCPHITRCPAMSKVQPSC
jgi:CRISPR/Cas system-associated exonuclease Cas4 (RecB family)